jgi:hypothetical protein
MRTMGRKTTYTTELADEIIRDLSKGIPLMEICRRDHMPETQSIYRWCEANFENFAERFARARADGFDAIAADCLKIADDASGDTIETEDGPRLNSEFAARSRIRIETRLKLLAKWDPKRYGERLQIEEEVNRKTLGRDDALAQLRASGLSVADIFGALTKPAEPVLEIGDAKPEKTAQPAAHLGVIDIDD